MNADQFYDFCAQDRDARKRWELNDDGFLVAREPSGFETGRRNAKLIAKLYAWNEASNLGVVTDSETGYVLPNGSVRAPDAAWISLERLNKVPESLREKFLPAVPDFVVEIRSRTDSPIELAEKMDMYMTQGVRLAWMIDRFSSMVRIYKQNGTVETFEDFEREITGEEVLPGFVFDLRWMK
ncbi:MAG: Uma2 family endonuclease [Saprospiraceae bacterium]|nr:Uma2 family endonuclease [Saprospiraceae bacterium]